MKRVALIIALAILGCTSSSSRPQSVDTKVHDAAYEGPDGAIRGVVVAHDGTPLPGVTVTLWIGESNRVTVTPTDGTYTFLHVPAGTQRLTAELDGFYKYAGRVNIANNIARGVTIVLNPAVNDKM